MENPTESPEIFFIFSKERVVWRQNRSNGGWQLSFVCSVYETERAVWWRFVWGLVYCILHLVWTANFIFVRQQKNLWLTDRRMGAKRQRSRRETFD